MMGERANGGLELALTVFNRGDEAARGLVAVPLYPPGASPSLVLPVLDAGQGATLGLSWGRLPAAPPGRRCAVLRLDLRDQASMPWSALGYGCRDQVSHWEPPLTVGAAPLELRGAGRLRASLGNSGPLPLAVTVRVFSPRELALKDPTRRIIIPPGQVRELSWEVSHLGAQAQARYPVLIHSALDLEGRHGERVDEVMVSLTPAPNPFRASLGWWLAALAGLAAWVALAQWRARRRR